MNEKNIYPSKQDLITKTQSNYQEAIGFYKTRRKNFEKFYKQNVNKNLEEFGENLNEKLVKIWNEQIFTPLFIAKKNNEDLENLLTGIKTNLNIQSGSILEKYLEAAIDRSNMKNFLSDLGLAYEQWLNQGINAILGIVEQNAAIEINQLIQSFATGKLTSSSAVVHGSKDIRSDLIISDMEILQPEDGSPVVYSSTNLPIELQSKEKTSKASLIIDYGSLEQTLGDHTRLGEYKKDINNFYGFSIKSWGENKDFKQFSQSSIIQRNLNSLFNSQGKNPKWEADYAKQYTIFYLSSNLIEIISPTTIGLIDRTGIEWMDEFLSRHLLYMQIQANKVNTRGKEKRILPQITNPGIYIRNLSSTHQGEGINSFKSYLRTNKQGQTFLSMRIKKG